MACSIRTNLSSLHHLSLLIAVSLAATSGCDQCTVGPAHCEGATLVACEWRGDGPFSNTVRTAAPCAIACADDGQGATCVDSATPVPACAGGDGPVCIDGATATCRGGFPIGTKACDGGTTCTVVADCDGQGPVAFCAIGDAPDPGCSGAMTYCDGGTAVGCQCGHAVERFACGDPTLCRDVAGVATCTISGQVDARCGVDPAGWSGFCVDNTGITCWQGVPVSSIGCGDGSCEVSSSGHAECALVIQPDPNG